jgi:hypothetical protein
MHGLSFGHRCSPSTKERQAGFSAQPLPVGTEDPDTVRSQRNRHRPRQLNRTALSAAMGPQRVPFHGSGPRCGGNQHGVPLPVPARAAARSARAPAPARGLPQKRATAAFPTVRSTSKGWRMSFREGPARADGGVEVVGDHFAIGVTHRSTGSHTRVVSRTARQRRHESGQHQREQGRAKTSGPISPVHPPSPALP